MKTKKQLKQPKVARIIGTCEDVFELPSGMIAGGSRTQTVSTARTVAIGISKELTVYSGSELGILFGRDHTTISYSLSRFKKLKASRVYGPIITEILNELAI